jgi:6-pyruvoyltetrahydropterin/6-carboxytetrahydropterin synthase
LLPTDRTTIFVKHNIEVAHRLLNLEGKCQQIHGHSMWVTLELNADKDDNGYALGSDGTPLDFGRLKKGFREYLDTIWDHHLHLNENDPLAGEVLVVSRDARGAYQNPEGLEGDAIRLPGMVSWPADPSVENIARWIHDYMASSPQLLGMSMFVKVEETSTNGAGA